MRKRILIVEDDPFNCCLYEMLLEELDVELDFANDGLVGVDKYLKNIYDLVLLDMGLPTIAGYDVAEKMRLGEYAAARPQIPIIAVSADNTDATRMKAFAAGVNEYLLKPINGKEFAGFIECHLNKKTVIAWKPKIKQKSTS